MTTRRYVHKVGPRPPDLIAKPESVKRTERRQRQRIRQRAERELQLAAALARAERDRIPEHLIDRSPPIKTMAETIQGSGWYRGGWVGPGPEPQCCIFATQPDPEEP